MVIHVYGVGGSVAVLYYYPVPLSMIGAIGMKAYGKPLTNAAAVAVVILSVTASPIPDGMTQTASIGGSGSIDT